MHIYEIQKTLIHTELFDNLYAIQKIMNELTIYAELIQRINKDDFEYIDIVVSKTKVNLEKIFCLFKLNHKEVLEKII